MHTEERTVKRLAKPIPQLRVQTQRNGTANKKSMKIVFFILSYSLWLLILYLLTLLPLKTQLPKIN